MRKAKLIVNLLLMTILCVLTSTTILADDLPWYLRPAEIREDAVSSDTEAQIDPEMQMQSEIQLDPEEQIDLELVEEIETAPQYYDSAYPGQVYDSGVGGTTRRYDMTQDVSTEEAILQIRNCIIFLIFGVIPLLCACLIVYLFCRWIYGLIIRAV